MEIMAGVCLLMQSIWDIRTKEIPMWVSLGFGGCSLLYSLCNHRDWRCICLAVLPGVVCLLLGYCTRQAVGYGDGILICALGMLYTLEEVAHICMVAIMIAGITGMILFIIFKKSGKYEIPFVPFLLLGWLCLYAETIAGGMIS